MNTDYPFKKIYSLINKGDYCDLATGDPSEPPSKEIINAVIHAVKNPKGYPDTIGNINTREAIANYLRNSCKINLDPNKHISVTNGTKGAISRFSNAFIKENDIVIVPTPSYPIYDKGVKNNKDKIHYVPLLEENNFLPQLKNISKDILKKTKMLWLNNPNNPTGKIYSKKYLQNTIDLCRTHDIILCCDEAYIDLYYDKKPSSILEVADSLEKIIAFRTFSKRNNMADYRAGFVVGDSKLMKEFHNYEYHHESGVPSFIQEAMVTALQNEEFPKKMRALYSQKIELIKSGLESFGLKVKKPEGGFYIWQKLPQEINAEEFCTYLREGESKILAMPGNWIANKKYESIFNQYVRFALVDSVKNIESASQRMIDYSNMFNRR